MALPILSHDYILVNPLPANAQVNVNLSQYILDKIKNYGNSIALINSVTDTSITYSEIYNKALIIAEVLRSKGVKPGDVVGISTENRLEFASVALGIVAIGATCAPLNPLYNKDELLHILSISKPVIIFCSPFTIENIDEVKNELPFIKELFLFNNYNLETKFVSYEDLVKQSVDVKEFKYTEIEPENSVAFLFCSSGTTGLPKCVELTHTNYMCLFKFTEILWGQTDNTNKAVLGLIPHFHGFGNCILLFSLNAKMLNVVMPRFEEENFLESIQKFRITHLIVVPPLILFLSKHPLVPKYDLSSIEKIVCGAAPLSKDTQLEAQKRLKLNFDIQQGYGMTELSICCAAFLEEKKKIGSSGTQAPGTELKIVDIDTKKNLPPFQRGELCFRGPFVMKGYRNNIKATEEVFDEEGWFHTGDIGYYDDEGYIYIVDRLKELIKYKGFQVAPAELETILLNHPAIKDAGVIGIPDEEAGELPLAFVVKQPGVNITEEEIKKYVAGKVSAQKRLYGGVKFVDEIPKNLSGKILRRELRVMATSKL